MMIALACRQSCLSAGSQTLPCAIHHAHSRFFSLDRMNGHSPSRLSTGCDGDCIRKRSRWGMKQRSSAPAPPAKVGISMARYPMVERCLCRAGHPTQRTVVLWFHSVVSASAPLPERTKGHYKFCHDYRSPVAVERPPEPRSPPAPQLRGHL